VLDEVSFIGRVQALKGSKFNIALAVRPTSRNEIKKKTAEGRSLPA
jgi:hypothetical protein